MFYNDHAQCDLLLKISCANRYLNQIFQSKNCSYYNSTVKYKSWNLRFCSSNIARRQYWSSEQICLELKVWMWSVLNIRTSRLEVSCKKSVLKVFAKLIEYIKNIRDAVFNLKFQAKRSAALLKRNSGIYAFLRILKKF